MNEAEENVSVEQILRVLRRRRVLVLLCVLAGAAAGVLIAALDSERYAATATVLIGPAPGAAGGSDQAAPLSAEAAARLVRTRGAAERVARELEGEASPEDVLGMVSASADESGFVNVTASASSPERAAEIANAFADQFIAGRTASLDATMQEAAAAVERQLEGLPAGRDRASLQAELADLRATMVLSGIGAEVIDPAVAGAVQRDFEPVSATVVGAGLGLLLGLIFAFGLSALDPRVRSLSEISQLLPVPHLASVAAPAARRVGRRRAASVHAVDPEPFQHLRSTLLILRGERNLQRLVVTSPIDPSEGKTVVTASLALALARMGLRVCVVDADLRNAQLASQFGIDASPGLVEILRGTQPAEACHAFPVGEGSGNGGSPTQGRELTVIPSAPAGADAAQLLAGPRLGEVLAELDSKYDTVIIDAAPVLAGGETLELAEGASGTILVVRHSHTTRRAAVRSARIVTEAKGTILGVVATGVPSSELSSEGSGPWPTSAGTPAHGP